MSDYVVLKKLKFTFLWTTNETVLFMYFVSYTYVTDTHPVKWLEMCVTGEIAEGQGVSITQFGNLFVFYKQSCNKHSVDDCKATETRRWLIINVEPFLQVCICWFVT